MLRTTLRYTGNLLTFELEGHLGGSSLTDLQRCWLDALNGRSRPRLRVDLTGVTSIDAGGKACLMAMFQQGAAFVGADCWMIAVVEEITQAQTGAQIVTVGRGSDPGTAANTKSKD